MKNICSFVALFTLVSFTAFLNATPPPHHENSPTTHALHDDPQALDENAIQHYGFWTQGAGELRFNSHAKKAFDAIRHALPPHLKNHLDGLVNAAENHAKEMDAQATYRIAKIKDNHIQEKIDLTKAHSRHIMKMLDEHHQEKEAILSKHHAETMNTINKHIAGPGSAE